MKYKELLNDWKRKNGFKSVAALNQRLDNFRILFAYNSGKIENSNITYHETREIFENGKAFNFTGDPRTLFEQQNQKVCYDALAQKIVNKEPLTIAIIKEIHFLLTQGTFDARRFIENGERPGEFKKNDYVVGKNEVGALPEDIPELLEALIDEIDELEGDVNYLKVASYFHAKFEFYHPFADGNGRVGRTLLNYILMINDYPPLIIYDEDKNMYYDALEIYDQEENIEPLFKFLIYETEKTWQKTFERTAEGKNSMRDMLLKDFNTDIYDENILDFEPER